MLNLIVTAGGIVYGVVLVSAVFLRNGFTEALRIDALFMPNPTESTRPLNLVIGLALIAYNGYSLFA